MTLRFASYNMNGWSVGSPFLQHLCQENDVIFVTEHWLLPQNLNMMSNFDKNFAAYAVSGVIDIES
jgi:hypothetical protein